MCVCVFVCVCPSPFRCSDSSGVCSIGVGDVVVIIVGGAAAAFVILVRPYAYLHARVCPRTYMYMYITTVARFGGEVAGLVWV